MYCTNYDYFNWFNIILNKNSSIIFYDKIAVISEGKIVEFASPKDLLQDKTSDFCKLINEMGTEGKKRMMAMVGL